MLLHRSNPDTLRNPTDTLPPREPRVGGSCAVHAPPYRAPYPAANDRHDPKARQPHGFQGVEVAEELAAFDID
jgi:hypothetical protein